MSPEILTQFVILRFLFISVETSRTRLDDKDSLDVPTRKVIKPDLSLLMSNSFDVSKRQRELLYYYYDSFHKFYCSKAVSAQQRIVKRFCRKKRNYASELVKTKGV